MKKGLIFNNTLMDVTESPFEVHSSMEWINVPDECTSEWVYTNGTVSPYIESVDDTRARTNATSQAYLASTDWYITRHAETAVAVPADVTTARAAAREAIV